MFRLFIYFVTLFMGLSTAVAQKSLHISYNYRGYYAQERPDRHLYINGPESVYIEQNEKIVTTADNGFRVTTPRKDFRRYFNSETLEITELDFTSKKNRTNKSTAKPYEWTITREHKEILGYNVIKAIAISQNNYAPGGYVTVWFAPDLPYSAGPAELWGLPGVILEYSYEESPGLTFYATSVSIEEEALDIKEIAQLNQTNSKPGKSRVDKRKIHGKMRQVLNQ